MDLSDKEHFQRYVAGMITAGGGKGGLTRASLYRGYEALTLEDEYMAESISRYMTASGSGPAQGEARPHVDRGAP